MKPASPRPWPGMILAAGLLFPHPALAEVLHIYSDHLLGGTVSGWVTLFQPTHPGVDVIHTTTNTLTAIQALINGRADVIAVGRPLVSGETLAFRQNLQRSPMPLAVGLDAIGIFVHRHDPRKSTTLAELENLYAQTRRCHHPNAAPGTGPRPRHLYGLVPASAGHFHFQRKVLCGASLTPGITLLADDAAVIDAVARQQGALGYASISLATPSARLLPLETKTGRPAILPHGDHLASGRYPLTHYLYLYLAKPTPAAVAFARTVLLPAAQRMTGRRFVTLPEPMRQHAIRQLASPSH